MLMLKNKSNEYVIIPYSVSERLLLPELAAARGVAAPGADGAGDHQLERGHHPPAPLPLQAQQPPAAGGPAGPRRGERRGDPADLLQPA